MKQLRIFSWLLMLLICSAGMAEARRVTAFDALMSALKNGRQVRVVIHYGECRLISDNKVQEHVPDAIGGMMMDTFEYFAPGSVGNKKEFVSSSHTQLIQHPRRGMVYNYAKIRISADGSVQVVVRYLTPGDMSVVMDESFYTTMADGNGSAAAHFFVVD